MAAAAPERIGGREVHPFAAAFPLIEGDAYQALVDDVREHGVRVAIVLDRDGRVADGRNRLRAALEVEVDPPFETFDGSDEELIAFIASANLARRHLTRSQAAMVAARLVLALRAAGHVEGRTSERIARQCGVPARTIDEALAVRQKGVPDLVRLAESGSVGISVAARLARAGAETQATVVGGGADAVREFAREQRKLRASESSPASITSPDARGREKLEPSAREDEEPTTSPEIAVDPAEEVHAPPEGAPEETHGAAVLDDEPEPSFDMEDAEAPDGFSAWTASYGWLRLRIEIDGQRLPQIRKAMRNADPAHAVVELLLHQLAQ